MHLARVLTGIYDEADLDDVVVAVASATGLVETSGLCAKPVDAATGTVRPHRPVLDAKTLSATLSILRVERRSPAPAQRAGINKPSALPTLEVPAAVGS